MRPPPVDARAGDGAGGTLYVVATPIGNLRDVTLRALEVLRAVAVIAAEDTRMTRRLLQRHGIENRLIAYHAQSGPSREAELLARLRAGEDLALVTDAGTPSVSDPGDALVRAWAAEGGVVVAIPGASAVLAAVVTSGVAGPRWGFDGFLPRSGRERRERLARISTDDRATVLFEAPGRLARTLADLVEACGPERRAAVCRELTKLHEQVVRGSLAELVAAVESGTIPARGEIAIVVGGSADGEAGVTGRGSASRKAGNGVGEFSEAEMRARDDVERLVREGVARGDAARRVAAVTGISRRRLYGARPDPDATD